MRTAPRITQTAAATGSDPDCRRCQGHAGRHPQGGASSPAARKADTISTLTITPTWQTLELVDIDTLDTWRRIARPAVDRHLSHGEDDPQANQLLTQAMDDIAAWDRPPAQRRRLIVELCSWCGWAAAPMPDGWDPTPDELLADAQQRVAEDLAHYEAHPDEYDLPV